MHRTLVRNFEKNTKTSAFTITVTSGMQSRPPIGHDIFTNSVQITDKFANLRVFIGFTFVDFDIESYSATLRDRSIHKETQKT